jgi:hypothetical protein
MQRTGFIKPKDENGIIPVVDNAWSIDEKVDNPYVLYTKKTS